MKRVDLEMTLRAEASRGMEVPWGVRIEVSNIRYDLEHICNIPAAATMAADILAHREGLDDKGH